ncbi:hypothetical protein H2200_004584 [Cladophialophora chaetospira]|uniref:CST complex subunit Ten1 n=1 Tax=Cladophialophora chaetospira TaxID=386627 RepID=A0AA38XDI6_9EURO|nr:hypothetical protein H2200_004584 [Cladophialophora chaetospira]
MADGVSNGPMASKWVFIHQVPSLASGTKVRLLGCIVDYDIAKGQILLEHAYPKDAPTVPSLWVDVSLVVENTKSTTLSHGTWLNVVGYVRGNRRQTGRKSGSHLQKGPQAAPLQAVLIWDAGAVRVGEYEYTLEEERRARQDSELKGN